MLLGKGVMVAMMAVFGQSLVSSMKNPLYLVLAVGLWVAMYAVSKALLQAAPSGLTAD